jgi:hypothetical protein
MNEFLEILQYMNAAGSNRKQLFSRQASRHEKTWENRLSATRYHLQRHDSEDDPWEHGADRRRRQEPKTKHDDTERMPVRCQPANSDLLGGRLTDEFLQQS